MIFTPITVQADQMGGVPCIRRLRIPVATVVGMVADGMTEQQMLRDYPELEPGDIPEVLQHAAEAVRERELEPPGVRLTSITPVALVWPPRTGKVLDAL